MAVSALMVVVSLAAFLWQAGVFDFPGTSGTTEIALTFLCRDGQRPDTSVVAFVDLEESTIEFDPSSGATDFTHECPQTRISSSRLPQAVLSAGSPDAPGDTVRINAHFVRHFQGNAPPTQEAAIPTVSRISLRFRQGQLLQYVGLGERDLSLTLDVAVQPQSGGYEHTASSQQLQVRPPEGFYVAASESSATFASNDIWNVGWSIGDEQPVDISFRNDRMSRLDHIVDSSISALLGIGAGGIVSAWLALRISRAKKSHPSD